MKYSLLALLLASPALAQQEGAAFLRIAPGARPMAMGEAFTAVADDLNSFGINPAGLSRSPMRQAGFMHAELFAGTKYDFVGYSQPIQQGGKAVAGIGFQRLAHAPLQGRDASGAQTGSFVASDNALSLAYGKNVEGFAHAGAAVKFIDSRIAGATAKSVAFDFGLQKPFQAGGLPLTVGAAVLNAGSGLKYGATTEPLPLTFSLGGSVKLAGLITVAADARHRPNASRTSFNVGTEYAMMSSFALRAGLGARGGGPSTSSDAGDAVSAAFGFGLKIYKATLDYSFSPYGELGSAQRISVTTRF